jgi:uncharacterized membrane protein required for colicin V production
MWMDIALAIIFVLSLVDGLRRGFIKTALDTFGWLIALVLAFVWYRSVAYFIKTNTGLYDSLLDKITIKLGASTQSSMDDLIHGLPAVIGDVIQNTADKLSANLSETVAMTLFNILCFVAVIFAIRIVLVLFAGIITKSNKDNVLGGLDRLAGLFAGALKGIIVIYFFLAIMTAVIGISKGDFLKSSMEDAPLTKYMYEHNLIFIVVKDVL